MVARPAAVKVNLPVGMQDGGDKKVKHKNNILNRAIGTAVETIGNGQIATGITVCHQISAGLTGPLGLLHSRTGSLDALIDQLQSRTGTLDALIDQLQSQSDSLNSPRDKGYTHMTLREFT